MPKRFAIRLPNYDQRLNILKIMLAQTPLDPKFSYEELARRTDGLSGSDLKETCRNAAMRPVRELMRVKGAKGVQGMEEAKREGFQLRPLSNADFAITDSHAYNHVEQSGSRRYRDEELAEPVD